MADQFTLEAAARRTGSRLLAGSRAHLIAELDGQEQAVRSDLEQVEALLEPLGPVFVRRGLGEEGCQRIWEVRREFSFALRDTGLAKLNQDIVVPRAPSPVSSPMPPACRSATGSAPPASATPATATSMST